MSTGRQHRYSGQSVDLAMAGSCMHGKDSLSAQRVSVLQVGGGHTPTPCSSDHDATMMLALLL